MSLLVGQCLQNVHLTKKEINLIIVEEKNCIEKLCKKLKKHAMKIINYEEKEMMPLAYEENKSFKEQEACHICEEKFFMDKDHENYKNRKKFKDDSHYTGKFRGAAHRKRNLNYKVPKDVPIIIHNAKYDTHFIINQSAEEFNGELNCIGENMEKYFTFSVPIKKKCDDSKTITYKLRFIDSFRFCRFHYQNLLITCLKILLVQNTNHAKKIIDAKNAKN